MRKIVLDTNIFFNFSSGVSLGKNPKEVIENLTREAEINKNIGFFMPASAVEELLGFFDDKDAVFLRNFISQIVVKAPDFSKVLLSSYSVREFIAEVKRRNHSGLKIAEEIVRQISVASLQNLSKKSQKEEIFGEFIKRLRERYRHATRWGILDSPVDFDLIVLALEIDGFLVTTDEGLIRWGRIFGVKEMWIEAFVQLFSKD